MDMHCPICSKEISRENFRDDLSFREFHISGLCQACQDSMFEESGIVENALGKNATDAEINRIFGPLKGFLQ